MLSRYSVLSKDTWIQKSLPYYEDLASLCNFSIAPGSSVLHLGGGNGWLLKQITVNTQKKVCLAPTQPEFETKPSSDLSVSFSQCSLDGAELPKLFPEEKFDFVILQDLIPYASDMQFLLQNVKKVLQPNGRILVTTYNSYFESIFKLAERIGLKSPSPIANWLTIADIKNICELEKLETVKSGSRVLVPKFGPRGIAIITKPIVKFLNRYLAPLMPSSLFSFYSYFIVRKSDIPSLDDNSHKVSVVVPARNESGNIPGIIERLPKLGAQTELIFIEGNSTDDTWETIQSHVAKGAPHKPWLSMVADRQTGKGKGDAVRKGFSLATGDLFLILDADMTVAPEELPKFLVPMLNRTADFVHGSRLVYPMEGEAMRFLNKLGNKFFSILFTFLLGQRFKDTLCGTKVVWKKDYERIVEGRKYFGDFDPFGDFDLLFGAAKLNLKILEVPVHYRARTYGDTNIQRFRHGWILLKMCAFAARRIKFI